MTDIQYTPKAIEDILRLVMFVHATEPDYAEHVANIIESGILILQNHPYVGRLVTEEETRELVISYGKSGYIALYKYNSLRNMVTILTIRHQREVDYH